MPAFDPERTFNRWLSAKEVALLRGTLHERVGPLMLTLAVLCGCNDSTSSSISAQFSASNGQRVDLQAAADGKWDRVCVLGPYSTEADAAQALGVSWPAEARTDIAQNDGISLLTFVQGKSVLKFVEHPRNSGDFSNLGRRCFPRTRAKFVQQDNPARGWPGLFPAEDR
jgi:hypothetical protein